MEQQELGDGFVLGQILHNNGRTRLVAKAGSLLDFVGDAIVNAANEGCVGGFGIDEQINRAAGNFEIKEARKLLGGCPTGQAKTTASFQHTKCQHIIHAVGPVYRKKLGSPEPDYAALDALLRSAYRSALKEAKKLQLESIGFCILSGGVFRGERDLGDIIAIGVDTLLENSTEYPEKLTTITLFAFTKEEQDLLSNVMQSRTPDK